MTRIITTLFICFFVLTSCHEDADDGPTLANVTFNFSHAWDGTPVSNTDFDDIKFINENGDMLSIIRLRYLISNITFQKANGTLLELEGYNLVNFTTGEGLSFKPVTQIPIDNYVNVTFTLGLKNEDNINGIYSDLNSKAFNVPTRLGGGYHYMQFDGNFINSLDEEQGFAYHTIRAVDNAGPTPTFPQDTFIKVSLGKVTVANDATLNIEMNIAEWFKNPNLWDLNVLNQSLMSNSAAQILMFENGQNAFSLKSVE